MPRGPGSRILAITVGIVTESFPGERRVAMTPSALTLLNKTGTEFVIESGAGIAAGFTDAEYRDKGVRVVGERAEVFESASVLLQVRALGANRDSGRADLPLLR